MTEQEYMRLTNLVNIRAAQRLLAHVVFLDDDPSKTELHEVYQRLDVLTERLQKHLKIR